MSRLIDEQDVMEMLTKIELCGGSIAEAKMSLSGVKTAYSLSKVKQELKSHNNTEKMSTGKLFGGKHIYYRAISVTKAIKIVEAGGIDGK